MLESPDISLDELAGCVRSAYGLAVDHITFLPLGADINTAVFRVVAGASNYFLKLRSGTFDETSVMLPAFLSQLGNPHIIPIVPTTTNVLWSRFNDCAVILYPFVDGRNGFSVKLSPAQWQAFGHALKHIHTANVPVSILEHIPIEQYSPAARDEVLATLDRIGNIETKDVITRDLIALMNVKRGVIMDLVSRASRLANVLQSQSPAFVVCHSDIHAGNVLVDNEDHLFIVDWDNVICAPKERDLMFFGGDRDYIGYTPDEEARMFFSGYGDAQVNQVALAYYRYERIVQDIYAFSNVLLLSEGDGEDRRQSLKWLTGNFDAGSTIELAYKADRNAWPC